MDSHSESITQPPSITSFAVKPRKRTFLSALSYDGLMKIWIGFNRLSHLRKKNGPTGFRSFNWIGYNEFWVILHIDVLMRKFAVIPDLTKADLKMAITICC